MKDAFLLFLFSKFLIINYSKVLNLFEKFPLNKTSIEQTLIKKAK